MSNTPCFIIKKDELDENISTLKSALNNDWGKAVFSYSVKTNSLPWLLSYLKECGAWAEVVSSDEYNLARKLGYSPERIVFNGPVKGRNEFDEAFYKGAIINIDSNREIDWLESMQISDARCVGLRVNFSIEDIHEEIGWKEDGTRFGFNYENGELGKAISRINAINNLKVGGLHMHVSNPKRSLEVYKTLARTAGKIINEFNLEPEYVDIGGSFFGGMPGKTTFSEYVSAIKDELAGVVDTEKTALIVEPGSAIIASPVDFKTTVIDVKNTAKARMVTVDGSRCNIDPLLIKQNYLYDISSNGNTFENKQIICGFTCMDKDRIMEKQGIPELAVGDEIVFHKVGAYTMQMNPLFINFYPAVYLKDKEELKCIRKAWTAEDFIKGQV